MLGGKWVQWHVTLTATLALCSAGMQSAWFSPALDDADFKHRFHLANEEISWVVSIVNLGALFGSVLSGVLVDTIGRKWSILATNVPSVIGWLLIYVGTSASWLYAASIISGVATGMSLNSVPIYVGEIASTQMRGALGTLSNFMINMGILYEYVCGQYTTYSFLAASSCLVPLVCILCMLFVPESPEFLLANGLQDEAKAALLLLRGGKGVDAEIVAITDDINSKKERWHKALRSSGKPLLIVSFLGFMQQVSGNAVLVSYFQEIYLLTSTPIKPVIANVIVSLLGVVTGLLSAWTVEKSGRRFLSHVSCALQVIAYLLLGTFYFYREEQYLQRMTWLPLLLIAIALAAYNVGQGPLVFVLVGEILPKQVRAIGATCAALSLSLGAFFSTKMYPIMEPCISFWSFGILVLLTAVFYYAVVPETKGKTREQIRKLMEKNFTEASIKTPA